MNKANPLTPLPVGDSFFDSLIINKKYYVDKTLFVKDILDRGASATLCTRPRRFGKTLNQTMLKCFFEDTQPLNGKNTKELFNGLNIEKEGNRYMDHQGKYPVIFLSFKEGKRRNFDESFISIKNELVNEYKRHKYVTEKIIDDDERLLFDKLSSFNGTQYDYTNSLLFLCKCLENYHNNKVIILIDEYDVPLENSWMAGFYQEMIDFIRPLLSTSLKDNPYLKLSVMTGCLRISKESIFTGLNNLEINSILAQYYSEYFGFTQEEIDSMLNYYRLKEKEQIVKAWYNGYLFGDTVVYNPWSTINVISNWLPYINENPKPYWVNTSSNTIVRKLIDCADGKTKLEIESLMSGAAISKIIHEDITYDEIDKNINNIWNFLFFTGYLKKVKETQAFDTGELALDLAIPNMELKYVYKTKIEEWFKDTVSKRDLSELYEAIINGDAKTIQSVLNDFLLETISYMDSKEDFYHGLIVGILSGMNNYLVKSNRESGLGRNDVVFKHVSGRGKSAIIEIKHSKKIQDLENDCKKAIEQIEKSKYITDLETEGYTNIIKYGISFCKKSCEVMVKHV